MTVKQLRARIDRLERSFKLDEAKVDERKLPFEFPIDPALVKALRNDRKRYYELLKKSFAPHEFGPLTATERKEGCMVLARIAETARTISCPAGYGLKEVNNDKARLTTLFRKRLSPPSCGGGTLNDAEDAEEAQLMARVEVFNQTAEGRARERIHQLQFRSFRWISPAEQDELDRLLMLYPDLRYDPDRPLTDMGKVFREAQRKAENESRKRMEEGRLAREKSSAPR
jgi:hypothetical protein